MNALAGCDLVWEISHSGLLKQFESTPMPLLGGRVLRTPFDLTVPGAGGTLAHLIVTSSAMDINGDDTITLTFAFTRSTLIAAAAGQSLYPLDGVLTINATVRLRAAPTSSAIVLDLPGSVVSLHLSPSSTERLRSAAHDLGLTPDALLAGLANAIATYVRSQPALEVPVPFLVAPDAEGTLQPQVRVRRLRLRCFGPAERTQQGIGLFGALFAGTEDAGDPTTRDHGSVPPGSDVLVGLSERTFLTFVFYPSLAKSLAAKKGRQQPLPATEIPPPSGTAASITIQGADVTQIEGMLGQGRLQINTNFHKSVPCAELSGEVVTYVSLALNGNTLVPTPTLGQVNTDSDLDFWCELAGAVVFGPNEVIIGNMVRDTVDGLVRDLVGAGIGSMLKLSLPAPVPGGGVNLDSVQIQPDIFALSSHLLIYRPPPPVPDVTLAFIRKTPIDPKIIPGVWTTQLWCKNEVKSYDYTETRQAQAHTYELQTTLVDLPITVQFSVRGGSGPWQPLTRDSVLGQPAVTIPALECRYPHPLAAGGSVVVRDVRLIYTFAGNQVTVYSQPGQGNFGIELRADVLDAASQPPAGVDSSPYVTLAFTGDQVVMGDAYKSDLRECGKRARAVSEHYAISQSVPRWKMAFTAAERDILDDWEVLTSLPDIGDDAARHFRTAHADVLDRVEAARQTASAELSTGLEVVVSPQLELTIQALQVALQNARMRQ
jgi:hypothetical protein